MKVFHMTLTLFNSKSSAPTSIRGGEVEDALNGVHYSMYKHV